MRQLPAAFLFLLACNQEDPGTGLGEDPPLECTPTAVADVPATLLEDAVPRATADVGRPIFIQRDTQLGGPYTHTFASMAVHPTARRVYLGLYGSADPERQNLWSLALDSSGGLVRTRRVADSPAALPAAVSVDVTALLVDGDRNKLYAALVPAGSGDLSTQRGGLSVTDLDADGEPIGTPRAYEVGDAAISVYAMAKHPTLPRLYLGGFSDYLVRVMELDEGGEPVGVPTPVERDDGYPEQSQGISELIVSPDGAHLYVGAYGSIESYALDQNGDVISLETIVDLPADPAATYNYARLTLAGNTLVRRASGFPAGAPEPFPLVYSPLLEGIPQAAVVDDTVGLSIAEGGQDALWNVAIAPLADAYTGLPVESDVVAESRVVNAAGVVSAASAPLATRIGENGVLGAVFADGTPVFLTELRAYIPPFSRTNDLRVRVTVNTADTATGPIGGMVPIYLTVNSTGYYAAEDLALGVPGTWFSLDEALRDVSWQLAMFVNTAGDVVDFAVEVEVARGDPDNGGTLLRSFTSEVQGPSVAVLVPGDGVPEDEVLGKIELKTDHSAALRDLAVSVGIAPADRPTLFPVGCFSIIGGQGDLEELGLLAETVTALGCNMLTPMAWGAIPPATVREIIADYGVTRGAYAVYSPPSYFAFEHDLMSTSSLDAWAEEAVSWAEIDNLDPTALTRIVIADEPAWYYPTTLDTVREDPAKLADFHAFLQTNGLVPADFGQTDWADVQPMGKPSGNAIALEDRKLIYWTMRFFPENAQDGFTLATEAIHRAFGADLPVHVNWNNWNRSNYNYNDADGPMENNPAMTGPERATGSADWFTAGRRRTHALWTEDWVSDNNADVWDYRMEVLRSADSAAGQDPKLPMGVYVIPNVSGQNPEGLSYKILSAVGHGAKILDFFNFGPSSMQSDGWSDSLTIYGPLARAVERVGRSEHILYPAIPERGPVALYAPEQSLYFDEWAETDYEFEVESLHRALAHAGYRTDVIDAEDLSSGAFATRGYSTVYVTSPNVPAAGQDALREWVAAGGTLVATAGAITADEYDTPTDDLADVFGLSEFSALAAPPGPTYSGRPYQGQPPTDTVTFSDSRFGSGGQSIVGEVSNLRADTASVLATLASGAPAITEGAYGTGHAIYYGYYPGQQYDIALPRLDVDHMPTGDATDERRAISAPAVLAGTSRTVEVDREMIEALRLNADEGIAVVLLNWTDEPQECVRMLIKGACKFPNVTSANGADVGVRRVGDDLEVVMTLDSVDVLTFEP